MAYLSKEAANNAESMSQAVTQGLAGATPSTSLSPSQGGNNVPSASSSSPRAEPGINWNRIGRMMGGMGAGMQGRGAEYLNALTKQDERLDTARQQAMLKDLSKMNSLLDKGLFMEAEKLAVNRVTDLENLNGDTSHTRQLLDLLRNGEYDKARAIVSGEVDTAVDMGLMKRRAAANLQTKKIKNPVTGKLEMYAFDPRTGQFVGESLGEATGDGTTVNIDNAVKPWSQIVSRYDKQMTTVNDTYKRIQRVQSALKTTGGASPKALQAAISDIFGNNIRAIDNLKQWASFGNLPDDLINKAKKFALGDYTDLAKDDISRLLASYQEYNGEEHQAINDRFTKVANANKVDLDTIISEVKPFPKSYDFSSMTTDELSKVPLETLLGYQRTDFKNALDRIAGQ
tara:strand:- start:1123 stop:2322 length:1200 start_codon:yes stop_codon:yes gene_type:complete